MQRLARTNDMVMALQSSSSQKIANLIDGRRPNRSDLLANAVGHHRFVEPWLENFFALTCYGIEICTTPGRNSPVRKLLLILILVIAFAFTRTTVARGGEADPIEVYTWGQQPTSAATEQTRWSKDLELRPSNTPSDVMRLVPGLTISQHHRGGGKRTKYFSVVSIPITE